MGRNRDNAVQAIRRAARPLHDLSDLDGLLELIGDARVVLLGAATHGTQEFHQLRAEITRRLIIDKHFDAIAVADDAPAAPLAWLAAFNARQHDPARQVGCFGLDLYRRHEAMQAVLHHLDEVAPAAAQRARERWSCVDELAYHPQARGHAVRFDLPQACERELVRLLTEMLRHSSRRRARGGATQGEAPFDAQQHARVVRDAEPYWRSLFANHTEAWNAHARHLASTLDALREHLAAQRGRPARIVVWAHNAHSGDARATERAGHGQLSLGQLVRESQRKAGECFLLGFSTHAGMLAAAADWDAQVQIQTLQPSRIDSVERLLHESGLGRFVLPLTRGAPQELRRALQQPRLERAIGAVYRPGTERWSHYFHAALAEQFDAVLHVDQTHALWPLEGGRDG